jgi:putative DNA primase/helicase
LSVFDQAKRCITSALIESTFPGGEWRGDTYWCRSPLRADSKIGSFNITPDGLYYDHATKDGGDFIDLLAKSTGKSAKEAAEDIVRQAGQTPEEGDRKPRAAKKAKPAAVIPIPDEARASLNAEIVSSWAREHHGEKAGGWKYYTADGGWCFAVVRYNKTDGSKDVIPYFYGNDGRWHEGQAYASGRPLYNLPAIVNAAPDTRFLIVEGEKCASVEAPGFVVTTWSAGAASASKTDWSPLTVFAAEGRVIIWPDFDEPGLKAAAGIAKRLPGAIILDIQNRAQGWDIADAVAEGIDPAAFIKDCPRLESPPETENADAETSQFFRCLGYDAERYWFLREGKRIPQTIGLGQFNASRIQELAPLAWWSVKGMVGDQGGIKVAIAQDYLNGIQFNVGRYAPDRLRGAGVWRDGEEIIINDGRRIVTREGQAVAYADFKSPFFYLSSDAIFGDLVGDAATDQEGRDLMELFQVQGWMKKTHALAAMGWALIATFGGALSWRPHIWISGKRGTGKTWIIEHLIDQLLGPFGYLGTGKTSEAVIRRSLKTDARPVRLDEMEPKDRKSIDSIASKLDLERNSSSDASAFMDVCAPDGGVMQFRIRSAFCNASVRIPNMDAAIESRFIRTELRYMVPEAMGEKKKRSAELMRRCMKEPGRFRRRIFRALPQILDNIDFLRDSDALDGVGDQRQVDQWAPIIAAVWAVTDEGPIESAAGARFVAECGDELTTYQDELIEDEDRVIELILSATVESDKKQRRTVAELLDKAAGLADTEAAELLERNGLRWFRQKDGVEVLAIACNSEAIKKMMSDSTYSTGYDAQIRRHALCMTVQDTTTVRMAGKSTRARLLNWKEFREMYMKGEEG